MTSLIVDASVAVKWIANEPNSDRARRLGGRQAELLAPDLVISEVGNALWKKCRSGQMSLEPAIMGLGQLPTLFDHLFVLPPLAIRALEIAHALQHPIYDCFYLALAERERTSLISADGRLLAAANRLGTIEARPISSL